MVNVQNLFNVIRTLITISIIIIRDNLKKKFDKLISFET